MGRDSSLTRGPTGDFRKGSPGFTGQLKFKCEIWGNLPISIRRQQDQNFIFSPETIAIAPEDIRENLQGIKGIDGVFLAYEPGYQHNFVCAKKRTESEDVEEKNTARENQKTSDVIPLANLEFYAGTREILSGSEGERLLTLDGVTATTATAKAAHHMWINDGSLYSDYIILPSEKGDEPEDPLESIHYRMASGWDYDAVNSPVVVKLENGVTYSDLTSSFIFPRQTKNALASPVVLIEQNSLEGDTSILNNGVYKNINPGIHWRLEKRTPIFQGEDFWVEFRRQAKSNDVPRNGSAKFKMLQKFEHLDVNSIDPNSSACRLKNLAMIQLEEDGSVRTESLDKFDLSRQAYYMVEIGIGSQGITNANGNHTDRGHNYYILIAEKSSPIFCHYDKINIPCEVEGDDAGDDSDKAGSRRVPSLSEFPILRKLSTYRSSNSRDLMKQDSLRITVRQHLGRIIITFSGHEDNPWIIERSDLTNRSSNDSTSDEQSEADFVSERVPMLIANGRMAVMAGNVKCAFSFSPVIYTSVADMPMPQPLSVLGPIDDSDMNLLLRDKGVAQTLDYNTSNNSKTNPKPKKITNSDFQYNQDAEIYEELVNGRKTITRAIAVQPDLVQKRGKAPDQQISTQNRDRDKSTIGISSRNGLQSIGSDNKFVFTVQVAVKLTAGTYVFKAVDGDFDTESSAGSNDWKLENCITPIMTGFRLYVPADDDPAFSKQKIDVSHHVLSFNEDWSADGWQGGQLNTIDHQGNLTFLINAGMQFQDDQNHAPYLHSLTDKAFYVQVSSWWEGGIMPLPSRDIDRVLFTGLCFGGEVSYENNKRILKCKLVDYSGILKDQKFKNSPFFDKMRDFNAIYEILQLAAFRDGAGSDQTQPASLLKRLADYKEGNNWINLVHNGETLFNREFALPGSYDILQEPFLRFKDGDDYYGAIQKIASLAGKVFFFDRLGVFHYDSLPYEQELFGFQQGGGENEELSAFDWNRLSKVDFFASPDDLNEPEIHRQVFDAYQINRKVEDVNNEIRIISTTPDGKLLVAGHTNFDSLFDPDKPGFLGYPKEYMQTDGIFGDEATVKWYIKNLTKMFIPPVIISFKAVGRNLLRPLDIVTFKGMGMIEPQRLIIGDIKSTLDPSKNQWWQEFTCYWLFPSTNIEWGETNNTSIQLDGTVSQNNSGQE